MDDPNGKFCHKCRKALPFDTRILRSEYCPWCGADLHCCANCHFHDTSAYNECREVGTEFVRDRDRNNHCSTFRYREGTPASTGAAADAAKDKLKGLFKI
ncbi:hypothetical protein L6R50_19055 [Myxococcota bacterium]|nr:hypothetical protein [Myxococcota bacterium]